MKKRVTVKANKFILAIVAFLLCGAIVKLLYVALASEVDGVNLKVFASNRNTVTKTLYASRGTIFDSKGEALALSANSYTLIAYLESDRTVDMDNPQHVVDKDYTAKKLAEVLDMDEQRVREYLDRDAYQVQFGSKGNNLSEIEKRKIEDLELPGIDFIESTQRYYKMGSFASYIIGYAKPNKDGDIIGELGIEGYFNEELSGKDGYITYQQDAYGYQLPNVKPIGENAQSGSDIYLTIDSSIQLIAENAMKELTDEYNLDFAVLTVMDAKTGAIVASATSPTYNPNNLNTITSYMNPLVSYAFEPGSTMKIFSWASAIESGFYDGDEKYKSGSIKVADVTIRDFNRDGWGYITYDQGFAYSSNVAATNLALTLGKDELKSFYETFGFGKKTGIELANEMSGKLAFNYKSEIANAGFGQGITITPIQMLQALSSIANDGVMLKPYIVEKIVDENGVVTFDGGRTEIGRVMKKTTALKMQELMHKANYGDGENYAPLSKIWQPKTVSMMMKTGTAQIASPSGGYMTGKYDSIYSLAGIFPEENPSYIIYVAVKRIEGPQKAVANMSTKVVDEIAAYAKLTESNDVDYETKIQLVPNYISSETSLLPEDVYIIGTGDVITKQYPKADTKIVAGSKVFAVSNNIEEIIVPDFRSWSYSLVKTYCRLANITVSFSGEGYVISQSVEAGSKMKSGDVIKIELKK